MSSRSADSHQLGRDQAVGARLDARDLEPVALEMKAGIENGLVLDGRGDHVAASLAPSGDSTLDGEVVRLGGSRRPDDLARVGVDEVGNVEPRLLDRLLGIPPEAVEPRRGVAEHAVGSEIAGHHRYDGRIGQCRRGVVHVDWCLHGTSPLSSRRADRFTLRQDDTAFGSERYPQWGMAGTTRSSARTDDGCWGGT